MVVSLHHTKNTTMKNQAKTQRARVGVAGSFINQMMSNNSTLPEVGKGATEMHYTDRTCYEVVEVSKDGKTVKLEYLQAEWDKTKEGGTGHQHWILKPTGHFITVQWKYGAWRKKVQLIKYTKEFSKKRDENTHDPEDLKKVFVDGEIVLVEGITYLSTEWDKMKLIFGKKDYYYDWSF